MGDYVPLSSGEDVAELPERRKPSSPRLASLDVFRGLAIALMVFVDYAGSVLPIVGHAPWNGLRLADFVMPFFLFIAGISLALVYKRILNKFQASFKAIGKTAKLFLLGILLQGGYFHGLDSLSFGIDIERIRWLGILQRIAIGYVTAALCEIWSANFNLRNLRYPLLQKYYPLWFMVLLLSCLYSAMLHGLYVPDWQYKLQRQSSSIAKTEDEFITMVVCSVKGDLGPGCNSAGMIDRYVLGINHLYGKPTYRNLMECRSVDPPTWCCAPFDPEGVLSSLMAAVTCLLGLHFGHVLVHLEDHKERLRHWLFFSLALFLLGFILYYIGIPFNKPLYTTSYTFVATGVAGITFCLLYFLVDICHYDKFFFILGWMGRHSLSIFILIASNMVVIAVQGVYWQDPKNNIIHWVISHVKK